MFCAPPFLHPPLSLLCSCDLPTLLRTHGTWIWGNFKIIIPTATMYFSQIKNFPKQVVVHVCNPRTQKTKAGGSWIRGQPGLQKQKKGVFGTWFHSRLHPGSIKWREVYCNISSTGHGQTCILGYVTISPAFLFSKLVGILLGGGDKLKSQRSPADLWHFNVGLETRVCALCPIWGYCLQEEQAVGREWRYQTLSK